jgi:hypothetical protein
MLPRLLAPPQARGQVQLLTQQRRGAAGRGRAGRAAHVDVQRCLGVHHLAARRAHQQLLQQLVGRRAQVPACAWPRGRGRRA